MILAIIIVAIFLSIVYIGIIAFLYKGLRNILPHTSPHNLSFSVVIAARNEENNITECLESVLTQTIDAARYEVILVNDRSSDRTAQIADLFAQKHVNFSVITIDKTPDGFSPKKFAVQQGINSAKNEIIVFTDADCTVPPSWLSTIDAYFYIDTGLVQGITTYSFINGMNRLFYGLQAVDFLSHGVVAAAAIGANLPINSNANNFAFRKQAFVDATGYGKNNAVVSGDDDLLLQRIWETDKWNIRFMADLKGAVQTLPSVSISQVFEQRKRWGSKTIHYSVQQIALLSGVFFFYLSIALTFCAGFFMPQLFAVCGSLLLVKFTGEVVLMWPGTRMFGQLSLRKYLLPGSIVQLPMVLAAVVLGVFGKFVWKEQKFGRVVDNR